MTAAPSQTTITIGTRASRLAVWQTDRIARMIVAAHPHVACRTREFTTAGDKELAKPLPEIGGKGLFTQELEQALLNGGIDVAVHSHKDLPTAEPRGVITAAICEREDARDVLIARDGHTLRSLPAGARVGTSSPRRAAQLAVARSDLEIAPLRGNVDTRVRKATEGEYDAIVIAAAGVHRLGLAASVTEYLAFDVMLPAPGQGALAVQCRADDRETRLVLSSLDDPHCRAAVVAERSFLARLGGGCAIPVGAYAAPAPATGSLLLRGIVAAVDGTAVVRTELSGDATDPEALGQAAAERAIAAGAKDILS